MASVEKISAELKISELKQDGLRKAFKQLESQASSLLLFTFQWKDLEDHFDSTRSWIQERSQALGSIEESIGKRFQEIKTKEEQFDLIQQSIDKRFEELRSKEKRFQSAEKLVTEERAKELDLVQKSMEEQSKELEMVQRLIKKGFRELALKEKRFRVVEESIEERSVELESIQISIKERFKELELKEKQFEECSKELELKQKRLKVHSKEFELKVKRFEERLKDLKLKEKRYDDCSKELESREKGVGDTSHYNNSSSANVELSVTMDGKILQMFLNERWKEHDSMHGEVSTALRLSSDPAKLVLDAMQGFYPVHLENGSMDIEVSVIRKSCILLLEQLMKVSPEIKPHVKEGAMKLAFDWMTKMRPAAENYLEVLGFLLLVASYGLASAFDEDELVSLLLIVAQHRQAPELCRVLGLADMIPLSSILHKPVKIKQSLSETIELNNIGASLSVGPWPELKSFCISMDGNGLRLFLNEHVKEHNAMLSEVFDALQCASDPVKIVLDAMQGFNSCNSDAVRRKKLGVNRMSCILLLEQLMRLSPQITPQMKEEAMKIAVDWKSKFREHNENPVKVLGFLQLVATFELTSSFKSDELFCLLKTVYHLEQAPHLCQIFGLAYEIPHFIHKLVKKGRRLVAVRYIYAFNLVDKFPPVPLLKDHVDYSKMHAEKICQKGNYSLPAQDAAIKNEINALMAVLKCIEDHKLKFEYPPEILKKRIVQLQKQKENKEGTAPASASNAQPQKQSGIKRPRTAVSTEATPNAASTIHLIQPPQQPACFLAYQGAPNSSTSATYYGFGCSTPADGHLSSSAGPYAMAGSTLLTPHMSSSAGQCRSGIAANGSTGQFGLAGTYIGGTHPGTSSPNSFIHYYPRDALSGLHDSDIPASFNGYSSPRYHSSPHP